MTKNVLAVLAYVMNIRVHDGAGHDHQVWKELLNIVEQLKNFFPLFRPGELDVFLNINRKFIISVSQNRFTNHLFDITG
jgi:hypothetical protein